MVVLFVPAFFIQPQYDFLYTEEQNRSGSLYYKAGYRIEDGILERFDIPRDVSRYTVDEADTREIPKLYRYDFEHEVSREISYTEAKGLTLDQGPASPDNYSIESYRGHDGIFELFGSGRRSNYVVTKGSAQKELRALETSHDYYYGRIDLLGWIIE